MAVRTKESLKQETTEELLQIWTKNNQNYGPNEVGLVLQLLLERGVEIPALDKELNREEKPSTILSMPMESNATLREIGPGKLEIQFPKDGFLRPGKFEFSTHEDFLSYLKESFKGTTEEHGIRGSMTRKGKYQRLDENDQPIFTFGDPILDVITNRHGLLVIGSEVYDLKAKEFETRIRHGGIRSIDLGHLSEELRKMQIINAVMGEGNLMLVENGPQSTVLASYNPSSMAFIKDGSLMGFNAWRKNYFVYWSAGAEIGILWGPDFQSASIRGTYSARQGDSAWCYVFRVDAARDTNDNYVDELEWGTPAPWFRLMCDPSAARIGKGGSGMESSRREVASSGWGERNGVQSLLDKQDDRTLTIDDP